MVVVSTLLHSERGRNDHREDAPHCIKRAPVMSMFIEGFSFLSIISYLNLNTKRCYYDSWLYISIPAVVLSLSIQTSTIGNDDNTIFSSSFWFDIGNSSYIETFQRFFKVFKCNKTENSVKARDQRIIFCFDEWEIYAYSWISCISFSYIHTYIFHQ